MKVREALEGTIKKAEEKRHITQDELIGFNGAAVRAKTPSISMKSRFFLSTRRFLDLHYRIIKASQVTANHFFNKKIATITANVSLSIAMSTVSAKRGA
ncbi:hypothetical protein OH492_24965 [Vibrio chagasii]|nr:hypothetical protein [Vibrio chagasii]